MAAKLDLSKQIGPLPLGAWVVVVGTGLGIAYYSRRNSSGEPEIMRDISGDPGVGTGPGWTAIAPPTDAPQGSPDMEDREPQTNEEWARVATNYLIAQGYDPATADAALRKYLVAGKLSIKEHALLSIAMAKYGAPPVTLPPGPDPEQIQKPKPKPAPKPAPPKSVPTPVKPKPAPPKPKPVKKPVKTLMPYQVAGEIGGKQFSFAATSLNNLQNALEQWIVANRNINVDGTPIYRRPFALRQSYITKINHTQNVSDTKIRSILSRPSLWTRIENGRAVLKY